MSDHHAAEPVKPWPGGWLVALLAGLFGAVMARWLGGVEMTAALLVGVFVFLVHAVVLAMYWTEPPSPDHGQDDGHGGHHH